MSSSLCCSLSLVGGSIEGGKGRMAGSGLEFGDMSATVPLTRQPQIELAAALVPHLLLRLHTYTFSLTPQPQPHLTSFSPLLHSHQLLPLLHSRATTLIRRCFGSKRRRHRHQAATVQTPALREGATRRAETSLVPGKGPQPCPPAPRHSANFCISSLPTTSSFLLTTAGLTTIVCHSEI